MTANQPKTAPAARSTLAWGVVLGLAAALGWAFYNVGGKLGREDGFAAADLTLLRFGVAALLMWPILLLRGLRTMGGLGWPRSLALAAIIGPVFGMLISTGFGFAPLAHAVVIGPGTTMIVANLLSWKVGGLKPPPIRLIGMGILLCGLLAVASEQAGEGPGQGDLVWLGDLCFLGSGTLWGIFTFLLGRWRVDPVVGTAAVAVLSTLVFAPLYLLWRGLPDLPASLWLEQSVYQGVLGGSLAIVAFAASVARLGAGPASIFPAFVPSLAILVAIVLLDRWPTAPQVVGIVLSTAGLLIALDLTSHLVRRLLRGLRGRPQGR